MSVKPGVFQSYRELLDAVSHLMLGTVMILIVGYVGWLGIAFVAALVAGVYR